MRPDAEMIFRLYDRVSESCVGQVILARHAAPAIRVFFDVLSDDKSMCHAHPADFELISCGTMVGDGCIVDCTRDIVATGASWLEMQNLRVVKDSAHA